jgi:hypothetical protein
MFDTPSQLNKGIINEWKKFAKEKCAQIMDEIPYR